MGMMLKRTEEKPRFRSTVHAVQAGIFVERWRSLVKQLERGEASVVDLKKKVEYAALVLESVYTDETRDRSDSVPSEVRDWLASTVTRQMGMMLKRTEEKPRFRSTVHAVQAGIFVER
ncbi:UNVERIFIED_CONTAM: hypothetical protein H355_009103 [Colinus virginianus]|nr:hypothetical protein H355_009103 [Colinus virginianus]